MEAEALREGMRPLMVHLMSCAQCFNAAKFADLCAEGGERADELIAATTEGARGAAAVFLDRQRSTDAD